MNTKIKIVAVGILVLIIAVVFFVLQIGDNLSDKNAIPTMPSELPIDVILEFYDNWLNMLEDPTIDPYLSEMYRSDALASETRIDMDEARVATSGLDPITCQTSQKPENFRVRSFPISETETKFLVESRIAKETMATMAFVNLKVVAGKWQITNIDCTQGDIAPEVEFSYDREGLLLKTVPPPYEIGNWHLIFEQDGQMGYVTPLFFSATTSCVDIQGVMSVCNPDSFIETTKVAIKGQMTELGAQVERVEFLE